MTLGERQDQDTSEVSCLGPGRVGKALPGRGEGGERLEKCGGDRGGKALFLRGY